MILNSSITHQKTYYEILSVSEDVGIDEIRTKYKAALLNTHPDKLTKHPEISGSHNNEQEFLKVQKAWEVLSNSQSKSQYDKELAASRRKVDVIANEIELDDMSLEVSDDGLYEELVYPCRCGDYFRISSVELKEMGVSLGENGDVQINGFHVVPVSAILQCGSCSHKICLLVEMILKEWKDRAIRASSKSKQHFYSANLSWSFFQPSLENIDQQPECVDVTDNEDESEAFFSVRSNFSHCYSNGATASWDGNKGAIGYNSVLEEFKHLEGWPFGLCRRPVVLPPLPNIPADSWMWRWRKSEAKSAGGTS